MSFGGNNFNHVLKNKPIKLADLKQFKHMLMSRLGKWGPGPSADWRPPKAAHES